MAKKNKGKTHQPPQVSEQEKTAARQALKQQYAQVLHDGMRYSINKLDDQLLYISSGALALSLTFIKDIVPLKQAIWMWLLFLSWISLTVCIGLSLYSHLHSYQKHKEQLDRLENDLDLPEEKSTDWMNKTNTRLLIAGIALQVIFAIINLFIMPKQDTNPAEYSKQTINIIAPNRGEKLGLPVAKAPKELNPTADSSKAGTKNADNGQKKSRQ